ncbi:hypothetical protein HK096_006769 [Nowakowskiella sp. JEL0078]|nr:hypothetical protein HK096_006769 [Nowakowskiella sp. JEL0078]
MSTAKTVPPNVTTPLLEGHTQITNSIDERESFWHWSRKKVGTFLNDQRTKAVILFLIFLDLGSCLTEMIIALYTSPDEQENLDTLFMSIFNIISDTILFIFVTELILKVFAFGIKPYYTSFLDFLDAFVTIVSFLGYLLLKGEAEMASSLLIGLRVFRIVDFMQGVTETVQERFDPLVSELQSDVDSLTQSVEDLKVEVNKLVPDDTTFQMVVNQSTYKRNEPVIPESELFKYKLEKLLSSHRTEIAIVSLVSLDIVIVIVELLISLFTTAEDEKLYFGELIYWLSWVSVVILSIFVAEIIAKLYAFGFKRYTDDWLELFDAFVVIVSFTALLYFAGVDNEAASLVVFFRVWRVVRILSALGNHVEEAYQVQIEGLEEDKKGLLVMEKNLQVVIERVKAGGSPLVTDVPTIPNPENTADETILSVQ